MKVKSLSQLNIGNRVAVSGITTYSYFWGGIETKQTRHKKWKRGVNGEIINAVAYKSPGTVIQVTDHMVYIELDDSRKPYATKSSIPECDGIWTVPQKQYACVSIGDLACGDKVVEIIE